MRPPLIHTRIRAGQSRFRGSHYTQFCVTSGREFSMVPLPIGRSMTLINECAARDVRVRCEE
jgi:hypothetical protein